MRRPSSGVRSFPRQDGCPGGRCSIVSTRSANVRLGIEAIMRRTQTDAFGITMLKSTKILAGSGDEITRLLIANWTRRWNYYDETANDATEGLQKVQTFKPDIILASEELPPSDGAAFLQRAQRLD